jgi:hypothetical protein
VYRFDHAPIVAARPPAAEGATRGRDVRAHGAGLLATFISVLAEQLRPAPERDRG